MDNIGDFAEQLVLGEVNSVQTGKALPPSQRVQEGLAPAGKDIQRTQVPDSFMQEILGEQYTPKAAPVSEEATAIPELVWTDAEGNESEPEPQALTEQTAQQLVPLLEEVKGLLKEMSAAMTGTGNIGVNMAGPQKGSGDTSYEKLEKSYGYKSTKKPTLRGDSTKKAVIKASIRNRLSKRNETY
jgi:hypothetical protein